MHAKIHDGIEFIDIVRFSVMGSTYESPSALWHKRRYADEIAEVNWAKWRSRSSICLPADVAALGPRWGSSTYAYAIIQRNMHLSYMSYIASIAQLTNDRVLTPDEFAFALFPVAAFRPSGAVVSRRAAFTGRTRLV
jgi:hypothetical protein